MQFALCFLVAALTSSVCLAKAKKQPEWLEKALLSVDAYEQFEGENKGLVLFDSYHREYKGGDVVHTRMRRAVHMRTRDERAFAQAVVPLENNSHKLKSFDAWIIYPSGRVESFTKKNLIEIAQNREALFSEARSLVLDRSDSVRDGTVFAFEYELSERSVFLEEAWLFQNPIPTVYSELEVKVPSDWQVKSQLFNGVDVSYAEEAGVHRWQASDLPSLRDEASRPPLKAVFGMVGVSIFPDTKTIGRYGLKVFEDWSSLARYAYEVQRAGMPPSEGIARKAQELSSSSAGQWERIRAICQYVQTVNYVSVEIDLGTGGGYTPRPADFVFEKHYGDCKDMTVLTRSLLHSIGIESFPVIASVGREAYVHEGWASPSQFNHCVVGIPVPNEVDEPAVVDHPQHGRLMIFDPTQKDTPVGRLPESLQGTMVLVGSELCVQLNELPTAHPDQNRLERVIAASLDEEGTLSGSVTEKATGSIAESLRRLHRSLSEEDFRKHLEKWVAKGTREALVQVVQVRDLLDRNSFELELAFTSPRYARRIGSEKLLFNPIFLSRHDWVPPTEEERTADYVLSSWTFEESSAFVFPEGFSLESKKEGLAKEQRHLSYEMESSSPDESSVAVARRMVSKKGSVSPEQYLEVVDFFEAVSRVESAPVVLSR